MGTFMLILPIFSFGSPLEEELQKLKEAGIPTTLEELDLSEIPDEQNGALVYREVFKLIDSLNEQYKDEWKYIPYAGTVKWEDVPEAKKKQVADLILHNPEFIKMYQLLDKASSMKCRFYPKKDYEGYVAVNKILAQEMLPDITSFRKCQRILMAKAQIQAENGEINKSLETILTSLKLARVSSLDVPVIISQLVRIAMDSIVMRTLEEINEKGTGDEALHQNLIKEMEKSREEHLIYPALKNEIFIYGIQMYDWIPEQAVKKFEELTEEQKKKEMEKMKKENSDITEDYIKSVMEHPEKLIINQQIMYIKTMRQVLSIINTPYENFNKEMKIIEEELKKTPATETAMVLNLPLMISRAYLQETRDKAYLGAAEIGIANRIYRQKHGKFTDSLSQLAPDILPALPLDPFTGKDYVYRKKDKGFIVYSVGEDLKDDGGVEERTSAKPDIVWEDKGVEISTITDREKTAGENLSIIKFEFFDVNVILMKKYTLPIKKRWTIRT